MPYLALTIIFILAYIMSLDSMIAAFIIEGFFFILTPLFFLDLSITTIFKNRRKATF